MPIVPSQIQRIEILRGPAAAVYGSEAVGAVINIISKTFASFNKEKTTSGSADISAGEYGYISGSAAFYKTNKKINYSLAGQSSNATGQLLRGQNRGYFYNSIFSAMGGMEFKHNWKLFLQSSLDRRDFAAQNFYTIFVSDTAEETVSTWWNHAKLKHSSVTTTDEIDVALKKTSDRFLYNPLSVANENHSGLLSVQYVHSKIVSASLLYNAGLLEITATPISQLLVPSF
jgi:iron complex outermembrane receptor protein